MAANRRPHDEALMRRAIEIARRAVAHGNHPFGALLATPEGEVLLEAENTCRTARDATGHAERNLMTEASQRLAPEVLARATLYTSTEPCAMCAGAAYWVGIARVVYGLSERRLGRIIGAHPENLTLDLDCRKILGSGQRRIEVIGPLLEDEAAAVHEGFWTAG
ncbi:nucleoside deaminase [Desertibaculum subflavum]|uniref:nucleoside deaminase n=1 Tax=Desertibaculum subflavum TaxID=2268458 RepID=UPI000E66D4AB